MLVLVVLVDIGRPDAAGVPLHWLQSSIWALVVAAGRQPLRRRAVVVSTEKKRTRVITDMVAPL